MVASIWSPNSTISDDTTGIINVTKYPYYIPKDGSDCTARVQAMLTDLINRPFKRLYWPSGTYLFTNPNNDDESTAAIVMRRQKRIEFLGANETKFICSPAGAGSPEFGFFRLEECSGVLFSAIEMDGSGIDNTTDGANRSGSFFILNFDVNDRGTNLAFANKNIQFRDMYIHDIGGGPVVSPRNIAFAKQLMTDGLVVEDSEFINMTNVNHGVGCPYTRNARIVNNRFIQNWAQISPKDCMAVDVSVAAEDVLVQNNYVEKFVFGMKCEADNNYGPSGLEVRAAKRVKFDNNELIQIGDPVVTTWPGPAGGALYGIKVNGIDCEATSNTITARTDSVTTGGLYVGLLDQSKHESESLSKHIGNRISGSLFGIIHDNLGTYPRKAVTLIKDNTFSDNAEYGVLQQADSKVENNTIIRSGKSGLYIQFADQSYARNNDLFDCASTNNYIIPNRVAILQDQLGAVGYFEIDGNNIFDSRGVSAAHYGVFARAGVTYTNKYKISPGVCDGLLTGIHYDNYINSDSDTKVLSTMATRPPKIAYVTANPSATAPWNGDAWIAGDEAILIPPVVGQPKSWKCTVAGTPGTWVSTGNL